jgi:GTP-binding protein EngB required for normal cell division
MLYEKYKPLFLKDYQIHLDLIPKLNNLCKKDISNILFYGPCNVGKMTLVNSLLNTHYKTHIIEKPNIIKLNSREIKFNSCNYYFKIILNNYYNKKNFDLLINYLCENNVVNNKYKLIIIKNIEFIDLDSFKIVKNIIEKKYNIIRFIFITSKFSKINNFIKGFFLLIRVPTPCKQELFNHIKTIYPSSQKSKITKILNETSKLTEIFMKLEINNINSYNDPYITKSNKLVKLIESKKISNILHIRELIYDLMAKNYNLNNIYKHIFNTLIISNYDNVTKQNIIKLYSNYNNNNFKNIIHIESLLINIMNIL